MDTSMFKLSDLPIELYENIAKDLSCYLVGLLAVKNTKNGEKVKLIGSDTVINAVCEYYNINRDELV